MITRETLFHNRRLWRDVCLPALDAMCIVASLGLVRLATGGTVQAATVGLASVATVIFLVLSQVTGLQRQSRASSADEEMRLIASTWTLTVLTLAVLILASRAGDHYARAELFTWFVVAPALVGISRMCMRMFQQTLMRNGVGVRRVAIVGLNDLGCRVAGELRNDSSLGWQLVGFFDDRCECRGSVDQGALQQDLAGDVEQMLQRLHQGQIDTVLIALPMRAEQRIREILEALSDSTASVYVVPDIFVFELLHARWIQMGHLPAVSVFENPMDGIDGFAKRTVDLLLASVALLAAAVPMLVIAVAVKLSSPGPVFFRQRRYGLDGREIRVWKFRSMRTCDDGHTVKQATQGDPRVTPVGALLRKTSLDELPQLFNVLGGSMSLVGPRPHATAHNEEYRRQIRGYMLRHKVKPGITGLAQVNGCRGETDTLDKMQRRIELDHQYIRRWSLWLDLKILVRTLCVVWRQSEAY